MSWYLIVIAVVAVPVVIGGLAAYISSCLDD